MSVPRSVNRTFGRGFWRLFGHLKGLIKGGAEGSGSGGRASQVPGHDVLDNNASSAHARAERMSGQLDLDDAVQNSEGRRVIAVQKWCGVGIPVTGQYVGHCSPPIEGQKSGLNPSCL